MRQVNRDELTWSIYDALRKWTPAIRRGLFKPSNGTRYALDVGIAADRVADRLRYLDIFDPADPGEPLSRDMLAEAFVTAIGAFPGAVGKLWLSGVTAREVDARRTTASLLADALDRFEILSDSPAGEQLTFPRIEPVAHALRASWP